jgi:hypothetical protein
MGGAGIKVNENLEIEPFKSVTFDIIFVSQFTYRLKWSIV